MELPIKISTACIVAWLSLAPIHGNSLISILAPYHTVMTAVDCPLKSVFYAMTEVTACSCNALIQYEWGYHTVPCRCPSARWRVSFYLRGVATVTGLSRVERLISVTSIPGCRFCTIAVTSSAFLLLMLQPNNTPTNWTLT
jgi:hypothetical protein